MRRSMTVTLVVGLLGTMLVGSASARSARVRWDPADDGYHDIRKVVTDRTPHHMVVWIGFWDPTRPWGRGWIIVPMDTHGARFTDRYVTFQERRCRVQESTRTGGYIGHRYVLRRGERTIGCKLPLGWFDINKIVRFWLVHPSLEERAPNDPDRTYVGLVAARSDKAADLR